MKALTFAKSYHAARGTVFKESFNSPSFNAGTLNRESRASSAPDLKAVSGLNKASLIVDGWGCNVKGLSRSSSLSELDRRVRQSSARVTADSARDLEMGIADRAILSGGRDSNLKDLNGWLNSADTLTRKPEPPRGAEAAAPREAQELQLHEAQLHVNQDAPNLHGDGDIRQFGGVKRPKKTAKADSCSKLWFLLLLLLPLLLYFLFHSKGVIKIVHETKETIVHAQGPHDEFKPAPKKMGLLKKAGIATAIFGAGLAAGYHFFFREDEPAPVPVVEEESNKYLVPALIGTGLLGTIGTGLFCARNKIKELFCAPTPPAPVPPKKEKKVVEVKKKKPAPVPKKPDPVKEDSSSEPPKPVEDPGIEYLKQLKQEVEAKGRQALADWNAFKVEKSINRTSLM